MTTRVSMTHHCATNAWSIALDAAHKHLKETAEPLLAWQAFDEPKAAE